MGVDGRHVTLGRHSAPDEAEIRATEDALRAAGTAGWLAVLRGTYYARGAVELLMVRPLGNPASDWDSAVVAFKAAREAANKTR